MQECNRISKGLHKVYFKYKLLLWIGGMIHCMLIYYYYKSCKFDYIRLVVLDLIILIFRYSYDMIMRILNLILVMNIFIFYNDEVQFFI